jgi:hypothetical protein
VQIAEQWPELRIAQGQPLGLDHELSGKHEGLASFASDAVSGCLQCWYLLDRVISGQLPDSNGKALLKCGINNRRRMKRICHYSLVTL